MGALLLLVPEAVARHGAERDDHGHGGEHGGLRLRKGGNSPGDGEDTGPHNVLDEVKDRPPYGDAAAARLCRLFLRVCQK